MASRELVVLGTASQAPTRHRNHNGYLLRWDGEGVLFDPGEGTQRQMVLAGVSSPSITRICITHLHGDHCLGLPGVLGRLALDRVEHPVDLCFPAAGQVYIDRLRHATVADHQAPVREHPVPADGAVVAAGSPFTLSALPLRHRTPTVGWRLEEPSGRTMVPERLHAAGIHGSAVGELQRAGQLQVDGRRVGVEEVSVPRRGQAMAFIMDTALCDNAFALAAGVDLLVCESTFGEDQADRAETYLHLTAAQAGRIAAEAGARRLVLTHFSQRYPDVAVLQREAAEVFPDVVAASDLLRVEVPSRPTPHPLP